MSTSVYTKLFARDFCLPLIETWCRAETTDPRQWTDEPNPRLPYQIFVFENGFVTDYVDETGVDWIKQELARHLATDPLYANFITKEFLHRAHLLEPFLEKGEPLSRPVLADYLARLRDAWAWFEAVWWMMEMVPEESEAFHLTHAARVATEKMAPDSDALIRASLYKLFPDLGIFSDMLSVAEIATGQPPTLDILTQRRARSSFTDGTLFTGEGISEMESRFHIKIETTNNTGINIFSGQTAYSGIAQGRVRIVKSKKDLAAFEVGEVLVSPMTMPEYLPAMRQAVAIVTDEGGITCHAAIVARELKKPCIIGTKIATEVLKDNDIIEVNADTAEVRILSSKDGC